MRAHHILIFVFGAIWASVAWAKAPSASFDAALSVHLEAVSAKDLPALKTTLTNGEALPVYFPNGKRTETKSQYLDFHQAWFQEPGWTMQFSAPATIITRDMAIATVKTRFDDIVDGKPYWSENWLTLIFRREKGQWRLVHDQNTRIRTSDHPGT